MDKKFLRGNICHGNEKRAEQPLNASAITLLFGKHPRLRAESQQKMAVLQNSDVPQWYVDSMCKIYYLFPKAHAAHYTKLAVAFAWFKVYYPEIFYKVALSNARIDPFVGCSDVGSKCC